MFALTELIDWRAGVQPDWVALNDERGDQVTYAQLRDRVERSARAWRHRGVAPGQVVAVLGTNSTSYVVNLFGLARLGAVPALLNWRFTAVENAAALALVRPVAIVADEDLISRLPSDLPSTRVVLHSTAAHAEGWAPDDQPSDQPVGDRPDDSPAGRDALPSHPEAGGVFAIGFSSGTTGRSKGIPLRHDSLLRSVLVDSVDIVPMRSGARHLAVAPLFHLAGLANLLMGLATGAEVHLRASFDPARVLTDIEKLRLEFMTVVPAMFQAMVAAADGMDPAPDTTSMAEVTYGASPIAPELVNEIQRLLPRARLRQFYGMTEIAGALTTLPPDAHQASSPHRRSAGRVNPGFEVRLVDAGGEDVADGSPGEILVRGPSVFHGYWNDADTTAEAFSDGWFRTGDIATRTDDHLTIMDRAKDMIVTGGENVYPAEVEAVLYEHPDVADAAVIGVPDDRFGERVHAVVVSRPGSELGHDSLVEFCRERLAGYKLPRSMSSADELPRNPTGKILRRLLREPFWEGRAGSI